MSASGSTCEIALKWSTPLHKTSPTKALEKCLWESRPQTAGLSQETLPDSTNTPAESLSNRLANVTEEVVDAVGHEPARVHLDPAATGAGTLWLRVGLVQRQTMMFQIQRGQYSKGCADVQVGKKLRQHGHFERTSPP